MMKVFISADIEGITTTTVWDECHNSHPSYPLHAEQMTKEVLAACEGAFSGGATEIVIKDAHGPAINIDPTQIPEHVSLLRNWSGHPYAMVEGIDSSFDCAMFIGYHSAAGRPGNPLSHTYSGRNTMVRINGRQTSEFMLYSWACALEGVPTVMLSGDKMLCEDYADLHPALISVPVKEGIGALSCNYSPVTTLKEIKDAARRAVGQDLMDAAAKTTLPEFFSVEVDYKIHADAEKMSYFPGCRKTSPYTVAFETGSYFEVLRTLKWIF
ncbi:MAG: M55 family metallopeptidase [Clostridiaceae bacterium]|nr:M55 family metallopeptidase [Clostridiaceae bacterium]